MTSEARKFETPRDAAEAAWAEPEAAGFADVETKPPVLATGPSGGGRYATGSLIAGKYQLLSILGEGGMGAVWLAKNLTLDVDVALKLMRAELADDIDGIAERMLQEARAAACIGHPAIIQVFDFGFTEHGDPFIVMELLRGESLSEGLRRRGRIKASRAAQTLLPIIDALAAAHERGIVHRDLKPENIFLSRPAGQRLQPKVLDFGIAKLEQRAAERLTRDGAVIGSPAYMAPEQLSGAPDVDARADVWALTVVLYQMIVGRRPFESESYHASMWNVMNADPKPIAEHGVDEPEIWSILQNGLKRDRAERFPDMRALGRALASWLLERGVKEDVCDASLRAWLDGAATPGFNHSFFPSNAPDSPGAAVAAPLQPTEIESGLRRIVVPDVPTVVGLPRARSAASRLAAIPYWVPLTLGAALVAFFGAALWSSRSEPSDAPDELDSAPLSVESPRPRRSAPLLRDADRPVEAPAAPVVLPLTAPLPESATGEAPSPAPRRAVRGSARRAGKSELKDPFE